MLFNLDFPNNTILSCFFLFFFNIELHFLIHVAIAQIFNTTTKLVIPIGITSKEAKTEIGICSVIAEAKIRNCSI